MTVWRFGPEHGKARLAGSASRRGRIAAGVVTATVAAMTPVAMSAAAHAAQAPGTPLKTLAAAAGSRYFGSDLTGNLLSQPAVTQLQSQQFNMLTPGNEMKWDTTEPSDGTFNFSPGDQLVSYAQSNGERVRCHNLVWQSQLPSWVSALPASQVQAAMETHITTEATHYKGECYAWDVVNEPFSSDGSLVADPFFNAMGSGYIADALRTARVADPAAKLYLNDFNIEGENAKSNAMFSLAQSLLQQGVPLDGIGFESHFILGQVPSDMEANLQRFASLGLDVAVTELDDRIQLPASTADLQQQAADFAQVVKDCLGVTRCVGVTQWAVGDADSWVPGTFSGQGAATMFDQDYQSKPAFAAAAAALGASTGGTGPGGACQVTYTRNSQWPGGWTAQVVIGNTGTAPITSWSLAFTFPGDQKVTAAYNGGFSQSGEAVTLTSAGYNGSIAPGGSVTAGFQGSWTSNDDSPAGFAVNGTACT